jgi:hypothetical protein
MQLKKEAGAILRQFDKPLHEKGETAAEVAKERMARWQRALELYVYCPEEGGVDLLKLLEKLIEGCGEVRWKIYLPKFVTMDFDLLFTSCAQIRFQLNLSNAKYIYFTCK